MLDFVLLSHQRCKPREHGSGRARAHIFVFLAESTERRGAPGHWIPGAPRALDRGGLSDAAGRASVHASCRHGHDCSGRWRVTPTKPCATTACETARRRTNMCRSIHRGMCRRKCARTRTSMREKLAQVRAHTATSNVEHVCVQTEGAVYYIQIRKSEQRLPLHLRAADSP